MVGSTRHNSAQSSPPYPVSCWCRTFDLMFTKLPDQPGDRPCVASSNVPEIDSCPEPATLHSANHAPDSSAKLRKSPSQDRSLHHPAASASAGRFFCYRDLAVG
ncbi:hypothetical protein MLP_49000 [Microlunatus phosphovorus NM-1]|uniref:Uncharacterized protein n=1 Tax=Microlunatus phosphovorus (strain ATCC 700054 / DSM 10555 / JCM 9379 / NBRC 101784 / NCIMB 13414 / VKM Ac-1990 / NM-1) TaxID=1032480 RepID=F5XFY0_MICPN|nr:hypothetical protein MLP_49000 [Microlunatus phosphovorus NM-1]